MIDIENVQKCWAFGSKQYIEAEDQNVLDYLKNRGEDLAAKAVTPSNSGYRPEIDITPKLGPEDAAYLHYFIGVLRWIVELGRIDNNVESSMLSLHLVLPREGNFQALLHIFTYIKKHMNT